MLVLRMLTHYELSCMALCGTLKVDSQMFAGWREYAGLFDDSILEVRGVG